MLAAQFLASHVLETDECDEGLSVRNHWLAADGATNVGFVVDMGCHYSINKFILRNSRNSEGGSGGAERRQVKS